MTAASNQLNEIAGKLSSLCKNRATGELLINSSHGQGKIHLLSGRLLYATAGNHPVRRWQRVLKKQCPEWIIETPGLPNLDLWQYQLLQQGITQKNINVAQAKSVIRAIAQEVFFDLGADEDYEVIWSDSKSGDTELALSVSLSYLEVEPALKQALIMQQQWQKSGLGSLSPLLAPALTVELPPTALSGLAQHLNGKKTIWDLASELDKSIHSITKALIPLLKKRILQFKKLPDFPLPVEVSAEAPGEPPRGGNSDPLKKALIACIDDSPVVLQTLKTILEPAGYQTICIQEPMRGVSKLVEHMPDLIILDLVMPNVNGYSVCKFLRQTTVFEKTPIVVLTSRDTVIDRNRAKLVGASDFLAKPPTAERTLEVISCQLEIASHENQNKPSRAPGATS